MNEVRPERQSEVSRAFTGLGTALTGVEEAVSVLESRLNSLLRETPATSGVKCSKLASEPPRKMWETMDMATSRAEAVKNRLTDILECLEL